MEVAIMRNNHKKNKRRKKPITKTSSQDYMSNQYSYREYSSDTYYNSTNTPKAPKRPTKSAEPPPRPSRTARAKAKKKKRKFFIGRIIFLISFIIGVIYVVAIVIETTQKPVVSYQMVQRGIIDNSAVFDGLIVRNEKVIPNDKEGNMYLLAAEGDRVKKNGQVYQILDSSKSIPIEEDIQTVESDIEKIQAKRQDISYYQNEIVEVNNSIDNYVEIYYMQVGAGSLEHTHELKKQLEYEITKRKNIHMKDSSEALNELKDQKESLSNKLISSEKVYTSPDAGLVSYYTDGFEQEFTIDKLDEITAKDVKQKYTNKSTIANQIIAANEPAYRIIKDNRWRVVSFMPEAWAERFKVGQEYEFSLIEDSSTRFKLRVEDSMPQDKQHKVIFSSDEQLELVASTRTLSFKSLEYLYEGLKIPTSAVTERNLVKIPLDYIISSDGGKGIMKSDSTGQNIFVSLNIQYEDESGYAHILQKFDQSDGLKLGDSINHPSKEDVPYIVSEVSSVRGVYVVNGRITKFKSITTIAENDEYLIIKPSTTSGLKEFDQIITNPKSIQEEQLLRNMDIQNNK